MLKLRTILLSNKLYIAITFLVLIYVLIFCNLDHYQSKYSGSETNISGYITDKKIDGNKITFIINSKEKLIAIYYAQSKKELNEIENNYNLGDYINLKGELKSPKNNTVFNLFNYKKYLYHQKIFYILNIDELNKVKNNNKLNYYLKQVILDRINSLKYSSSSVKAFALGDSYNIDSNISNTYQSNGISHLLALSGANVALLAVIILWLLKKIKISELKRYIIVVIILIFYTFLANYGASITRATLFFILLAINKIYYFNIKPINILYLTFSLLLIYNPYYIFDLGFQFSFVISFYLLLFQDYINSSNKLINLFRVSLVSFLVSMPITIYNFFQINLLSVIYNLFFVPLVSIIIYPLALITIIFPFCDYLLSIFIYIMEQSSLLVDKITVSKLILAKPNIIIILIYYIVITYILYSFQKKKYKPITILLIILLIHHNIGIINKYPTITMIDVGQGDSFLISLPHNKGNILIDTGGIMTYEQEDYEIRNRVYSIAKSTTIPYLKSIGITHLDYLICTHGDYDHMGEALNLISNFKVDKVIFNYGEYNDLELELINLLNEKVIKYYKGIDSLNIANYKLYFLNTGLYDNENNNSNVIYFNYKNVKLLFMGDAGIEREKDILNKYKLNNIIFLKVGHHGSNTSSSKEFINTINPKYSLISVGANNRYGHPKQETLNILSNRLIYRTDLYGSIEIKLDQNGYKIKTCNP